MEVTEVRNVTEISVVPIGQISVQMIRVFVDANQNEIARNGYLRYVLSPGDDITSQPQDVKDIAAVWWTQARITAWQNHLVAEGMA